MRNIAASIICLFFTITVIAQAPQAINYQGILRNSAGAPIANHLCNFRFFILQGTITGAATYVETQSATTTALGIFNVQIGTGIAITGTFNNVNWANGPYFLKVEYDTSGTKEYLALGTTELLSVPYALYSDSSSHCVKCDTTNYSHHSDTALYALSTSAVLKCLDTITGSSVYTVGDTMFTLNTNTYFAANIRFTPAYLDGLTSLDILGRVYKNGVFFGFANFGAGVVFFGPTPLYYIKTTDCSSGDVITVKCIIEYQGCKKMFQFTRTI